MFTPMLGYPQEPSSSSDFAFWSWRCSDTASTSSSSRRAISTTSDDKTLRAVLVGMLREAERSGPS
jgi:hypothetical protein